MSSNKQSDNFWVTNTSNRNVSLSDLAINIPAYRTVNLMDKKHYKYTLDQLKKSEKSGSLFRKKSVISVRKDSPEIPPGKYTDFSVVSRDYMTNSDEGIPSRSKSTLIIKEDKHEELQVSDEDFALGSVELSD